MTAEDTMARIRADIKGSLGRIPVVTGPAYEDHPRVLFRRLPHGQGLPLPAYETENAAGMDLRAALTDDDLELPDGDFMTIWPGSRRLIRTGFAIAVPVGYEAHVRPRSGLAMKHGITVLNSPGTIDADYRGEVGVILINLGDEKFTIRRGDRIAQMVIAPVARAASLEVDELPETARGSNGFGSTGT